ncbi:hypothetical protein C8R45DRAFT_67592 [Mycena sanguinolenta]|nr:hypothetical protein C8R45DRAFT_67592 [Mycena sanguinolenta]
MAWGRESVLPRSASLDCGDPHDRRRNTSHTWACPGGPVSQDSQRLRGSSLCHRAFPRALRRARSSRLRSSPPRNRCPSAGAASSCSCASFHRTEPANAPQFFIFGRCVDACRIPHEPSPQRSTSTDCVGICRFAGYLDRPGNSSSGPGSS